MATVKTVYHAKFFPRGRFCFALLFGGSSTFRGGHFGGEDLSRFRGFIFLRGGGGYFEFFIFFRGRDFIGILFSGDFDFLRERYRGEISRILPV